MAESAVRLVIKYLVPLLVQEARLLKGIHEKVRSIKDELEIIQSVLKDADARAEIGGMSNVEKAWVKQVREEDFHIEDLVDEYVCLSIGSYGRRRSLHFIQKIFQNTIKLKARHVIASKIQDMSNNLKEKSQLAVCFNLTEQGGLSSGARNDTWHDPRVAALFIEEANVVGTDSPRDKLINCYQDLPYYLKACFLYFGMFPEDYFVSCARLIRLWIAEGFVKEEQGITLEEVVQDYLSQLIHRSLVQVARVDFVGKTRSCRVHDMMRENNVNPHLESITSSQTRSILILGVDEVRDSFLTTCFANFKLMKTMDFEGAPIDYILEEVGNLFHLKYLSLRDTKVEKLPKSIGKLKNLETLDLKRSRMSELPMEISGLSKLRYLAAYFENNDIKYNINFRRGVKIHSGIRCLQSLEKLFKIEANNTALITELGSLGQLRKLDISKLKRECGIVLCTTLKKMSHL
ncbi:disease resistance protein RPM1-like [Fagus crenata]